MGEPHLLFASNLKVPYYEAIHAGRIVLVGKKQRKRVLCVGKKGGIYVKMGTARNPEKKKYLSEGGDWVITAGVR